MGHSMEESISERSDMLWYICKEINKGLNAINLLFFNGH